MGYTTTSGMVRFEYDEKTRIEDMATDLIDDKKIVIVYVENIPSESKFYSEEEPTTYYNKEIKLVFSDSAQFNQEYRELLDFQKKLESVE